MERQLLINGCKRGDDLLAQRPLINPAKLARRQTLFETEIVGDAQIGEEIHFLVDRHNAMPVSAPRTVESNALSIDPNLPGIRRENTTEDIDKRALSGAVLADEGVDAS